MLTPKQIIAYCQRNGINAIEITVYGPDLNEFELCLLAKKPDYEISYGHWSVTKYYTVAEAMSRFNKFAYTELCWAIREDMARKCPRRAVFPNPRPLLVGLFDDELPF